MMSERTSTAVLSDGKGGTTGAANTMGDTIGSGGERNGTQQSTMAVPKHS